MNASGNLPCLCGNAAFEPFFHYDEPPRGEVKFEFSGGSYVRDVLRCASCGHFRSVHSMDEGTLYAGEYVDSTYGDAAGMRRTFDKINALAPESSDNIGRVRRVDEFARGFWGEPARGRAVLDVGTGLCVFLHRMKELGWEGTALDPDARAVEHAEKVVGVKAVLGDATALEGLGSFDLISFNKVLEHVWEPVPMLALARNHIAPGGFCYVELPDGTAAGREGKGREEFFVEHHHVFSARSLIALAESAGFDVVLLERLREPSTKFTFRAFLVPSLEVTPS